MSRFHFVHASDLHLDAPFRDVGRLPGGLAEAVRDASLEAWDALVDLTIDQEAAFLLLAGGLCEGSRHGMRGLTRFGRGLERLAERGIAVCVALARGDSIDPRPDGSSWPPGITVFGSREVESRAVTRGGECLATVHGISAPTDGWRDCPAGLFRREPDGGLQIGMVGGAADWSVDDLRATDLDYWALGRARQSQCVQSGESWVVRPGALQGCAPSEDEIGPKGAVVVEVEETAVREVAFQDVAPVRFETIEVGDAVQRDIGDLRRALLERAAQHCEANPERLLLLTVSFTHCGEARRQLMRPAAGGGLLDELRRAAAAAGPRLWWLGMKDAYPPPVPDTRHGCPESLAAAILSRQQSLSANPQDRERFLEKRFEPLLQTWAAALDPREAASLLEEATFLAVDVLGGDRTR